MKTILRTNYIKVLGLVVLCLFFSTAWGQTTTILNENFASLTSGNSTSNSGSNTAWPGNTNFPTVVSTYQAGGAVRIGASATSGSITSETLDLSINGGVFTLKFDVKGWTTVEGSIKVTITGQTAQTVSYTAVMSGSFETKTLNFTGGVNNATIKIETTSKRAYIDNVIVTSTAPTSTTWNGSAWSSGTPTATLDAVISGNYNTNSASPQGPITAKNLSVTSGTVTVGANGLNIKGTLSRTGGTVNAANGGITFSGTTAQALPANFFASNTVQDLTLSNATGLTLSGTTNITGVLDITSGALTTNGNLTLKSTATSTARIAAVTGSIVGEATVERYIPQGKRAFRFLTSGVTTTNFISNNWQTGTHITGSLTGENGFDTTLTGNPSLYVYDNTTASGSGWSAIANTNATNLVAGNGYRILVRGDRSVDLSQSSGTDMNTAVTLAAKGTLKTGQVVFNASSTPAINGTDNTTTNGFSFIGNPYVSPVDWHLAAKSGIEDVYYTWDPNMGTTAQRGRYVAYSQTVGSNNLPESEINQYIQPGQAFFVKNTVLGTAGTLTFEESNKASQFTEVFRSANSVTENATFRISVYDTNEVALGYPIDGTVAVFGSSFDNGIGLGDVEKLYSAGEHLGLSRNNKILAIEALAPVVPEDELLLQTIQFQAGKSYTFKISASNFSEGTNAYLIDHYLNTQTPINLSQDNFIAFTTTSDANSFGTSRFTVVFNAALSNEEFSSNSVVIYPNPINNNQFNISLSSAITGKTTIKLYNLVGQEIYNMNSEDSNTITVNPTLQLSQGIYIVEVANGNKSVKQKIAVK